MGNETISVTIQVEGVYPPGEAVVKLPHDATLTVLLNNLRNTGHRFSPYLFDAKTGEPVVRVVLVNDKTVLQKDFNQKILSDGDSVFFILPVSGG